LTVASAGAGRSGGARWDVVVLLAAALFLNYVDRGALPMAAPLIQGELGLSARQIGTLFSAFFWSYALLQIPAGWLADRFGARRVLAAGLALWACATMLAGFAQSFAMLLLLRLVLGVGESAGFPSVSKLLASVVPVGSLGRANGIVAFGYLFGPAVGAYFGGALMVHFGWRSAFWVFGALSLLWLLPWTRVKLPRPNRAADTVNQAPWRKILRQPALWGTSLGHFSSNYTFYFMLSWLPMYLVSERGFSVGAMANLVSRAYLVNALSALLAGWLIDRLISRTARTTLWYKSSMVTAHIGSIACMLCLALAPPAWGLGAIFVYQVLLGLSSPGTFAISQILAGPNAAARWVGVQNALANVAGMLAPQLTGELVDRTHHYTSAFVVAGLINLLGVFAWVRMVGRVSPVPWSGTSGPSPRPTAQRLENSVP
jgi:MFS family permease